VPPRVVRVEGVPRWDSPAEEAGRFAHGQVVPCPGLVPGAEVALFAPGGRFVGVGRCEEGGRLAPLRLLAAQMP
jgi:hypothetical protein